MDLENKSEFEEKKERLWGLFHRKWTKDINNEEYNKKEWCELEGLILYFMSKKGR